MDQPPIQPIGQNHSKATFFSEKIFASPTVGLSLSVTALVRYAREHFRFARRGLDIRIWTIGKKSF